MNINIDVVDVAKMPGPEDSVNLWDCLTYESRERGTERHGLLMDDDHHHVENNKTGFLAVRGMCHK